MTPLVRGIESPTGESERLTALRRYNVLDSPPEPGFDRITALAARLFRVPVCTISLVDESRVWFKSKVGWSGDQVKRDESMCSLAVLQEKLLVIHDARHDGRFSCNPFVEAEPGIRFYAGAPLVTRDGYNLGTLCIVDTKPRDQFNEEEQRTLLDLAAMVIDELELRLSMQRIANTDRALLEVTCGVSQATGKEFFASLVLHLSCALDIRCAFVGELEGEGLEVGVLAACDGGQVVANFRYHLEGSPCEQVIDQRTPCCYPRGIRGHFPEAQFLEAWQAEGYLATPLLDAQGRCLGLLVILDDQAFEETHLAESLVIIFAERAAGELERIRAERDRTALLEETQQARLEAEAANRAKDEFLAVVSHELRTPLNPIIGWTQILRRGSLTAQQAHALEIIERNARLQNQLIDDLLDVSRIQQGKFSFRFMVVSLSSVAMSAMEAVRGLAEAGRVSVVAQLEAHGQDMVRADPVRLQQTVWNLLTNAIKFTPPDGCVVLRLTCQGNRLVLSVRDTGMGITLDLLPHIFERFRQGDSTSTRKQNGLGLGLFLVKHIVEAHGGTASAASDGEGKGATFTVELPLFVAQAL
ncbi:MAG: GAF domain-containing sensor histidine kinase [Gemmatimonadaceae bacterium]|nr:GAF domain-containing sensor histidine kinase [Gloeobacterales cyanobacterium ES-bin-141]